MKNALRPALAFFALAALLAAPASAYQWTFFNPSGDCGDAAGSPVQITSMTLTFVGQCKPVAAVKPTKPVSLTKKMKFTAKGKGDCLLAQVAAVDSNGRSWASDNWNRPQLNLRGLTSSKIAVICGNHGFSRYVSGPKL